MHVECGTSHLTDQQIQSMQHINKKQNTTRNIILPSAAQNLILPYLACLETSKQKK